MAGPRALGREGEACAGNLEFGGSKSASAASADEHLLDFLAAATDGLWTTWKALGVVADARACKR